MNSIATCILTTTNEDRPSFHNTLGFASARTLRTDPAWLSAGFELEADEPLPTKRKKKKARMARKPDPKLARIPNRPPPAPLGVVGMTVGGDVTGDTVKAPLAGDTVGGSLDTSVGDSLGASAGGTAGDLLGA